MDCERYQEYMSRMLDDDLSLQELEELREHVRVCPSCRAVFAAFAAVSASLREEPAEPPAELCKNVMRAVRARPKERQPIPLILKIMVPTAACFALIAAGAVYLASSGGISALPQQESAAFSMAKNTVSEEAAVPAAGQSAPSAQTVEPMAEPEETQTDSAADAHTDEEPEFAVMDAAAPDTGDVFPSDSGETRSDEPAAAAPESAESAPEADPTPEEPVFGAANAFAPTGAASVYRAEGEYLGELGEEDCAYFLQTVCTDAGGSYVPGGEGYTVDCGGVTYELELLDGALYYRVSGEESFALSPAGAEDFLALLP